MCYLIHRFFLLVKILELYSVNYFVLLHPERVSGLETLGRGTVVWVEEDEEEDTKEKEMDVVRGALSKSTSFSNLNSKPKIKQIIEDVSQKQKLPRESPASDRKTKVLSRTISKSMPFKTTRSVTSNANESKYKDQSPNLRAEDTRGLKQTKERSLIIERKISFKSDATLVSLSPKAGGSRKRLPDGVRLRGDINVLLLGDPSTAKSQNNVHHQIFIVSQEIEWPYHDDLLQTCNMFKVFAVPEASIGFHTDCSFSYVLSHLPGYLGEFLALTGSRLNGKEMIYVGLATHFVPLEKLPELEERLISLNSGDEDAIRSAIEEFSLDVQPDGESILNKLSVINECFAKESVEEIIKSFEAEASKEGNEWIAAVLKGLKRSSPTGLKINLRSIREGRKQTLSECLKKEFRLTMNLLRSVTTGDVYEGIRAVTIDKDNAPKWDPSSLDNVNNEKLDLVFQPFKDELELQIPAGEASRWDGKYENSAYQSSRVKPTEITY